MEEAPIRRTFSQELIVQAKRTVTLPYHTVLSFVDKRFMIGMHVPVTFEELKCSAVIIKCVCVYQKSLFHPKTLSPGIVLLFTALLLD